MAAMLSSLKAPRAALAWRPQRPHTAAQRLVAPRTTATTSAWARDCRRDRPWSTRRSTQQDYSAPIQLSFVPRWKRFANAWTLAAVLSGAAAAVGAPRSRAIRSPCATR